MKTRKPKNLEDLISVIIKTGYSVNIRVETDGSTEILYAKDSWFTNDLAQTVPIPCQKGNSIQDALDKFTIAEPD